MPRKPQERSESVPPKRKRGRPEKPLKIDDTPENVARALFGLPPIKATTVVSCRDVRYRDQRR